ncbi:Hypothetical protein FKW44_005855 [Caligus rogercresseyi]|uniref:Uncharacterized protein n=1 Tax=Caligus rogercresseyi TaxID=217165 RepID=A0A7T8KCI3_CALRO|nr:Hypothetical protein FKW44_005855 [Caligus rogercresseyi]
MSGVSVVIRDPEGGRAMPERLPLLEVRVQETCRRRLHEWSLRSHPRQIRKRGMEGG